MRDAPAGVIEPSTGPRVAPGLAPAAMLGRWHIVATTLSFWRGKDDPTVEYGELGAGRWSDVLRWRDARGRARTLEGIDVVDATRPGRFRWRGRGMLAWVRSEWAFVEVAPDARWAVTWFSRATLGLTPEGMDVYSREPELGELDAVLEAVRARGDLPRGVEWYRTTRAAR